MGRASGGPLEGLWHWQADPWNDEFFFAYQCWITNLRERHRRYESTAVIERDWRSVVSYQPWLKDLMACYGGHVGRSLRIGWARRIVPDSYRKPHRQSVNHV